MGGSWVRALFSFRGRLSRGAFWWSALVACTTFAMTWILLDRSFGFGAAWAAYPVFGWVALAIGARRLHDRGHALGWLLLLLVPAIGPVLLLIELGLRRGTPGENDYGPDPLERRADYMSVR